MGIGHKALAFVGAFNNQSVPTIEIKLVSKEKSWYEKKFCIDGAVCMFDFCLM
jgi:hypothetical protein